MGDNLYIFIIIALAVLAITDLIVGVSNDAVNFLNSAIGSKAVSFKTIMIVASVGIAFGALASSGMMEVARKGIFNPGEFMFSELMIIFMAVMITDVLLLDFFNTMGLPTSTTVSIVFELLGAAVAISLVKILNADQSVGEIWNYINTTKATEIILGILLSVVIAFTVGVLVQFVSRIFLTFKFDQKPTWKGALFGGLAITAIIYFILIKGMGSAPFFKSFIADYLNGSTNLFLILNVVVWSLFSWLGMAVARWNIYKIIIILGTFALAMAFAGNDMVNFIGVPIAAYQSFLDWQSSGLLPEAYTMENLSKAVPTPSGILLFAGLVMVITLWFSSKAKSVVKTSVDLSRQDEVDERFEPNYLSRRLVKYSIQATDYLGSLVPQVLKSKIDSRFHKSAEYLPKRKAADLPAFDLVRASVNLMVASVLISLATSMKLPLSTTYVTFMVAMGTSLADRAWGPESAVYRVAGVLNVIGGWFFTAFIAFISAALVAYLIYLGGFWAMATLLVLAFALIGRNYVTHRRQLKETQREEKLQRAESRSILGLIEENSSNIALAMKRSDRIYSSSIDGLSKMDINTLRKSRRVISKLEKEIEDLKGNIFFFIKNLDESNIGVSQFYLTMLNYLEDLTQSLEYISKAGFKHVNNNHKKLRFNQIKDLKDVEQIMHSLFAEIQTIFEDKSYQNIVPLLVKRENLIEEINNRIERQVTRTRLDESSPKNTALYFSILSETKDLLAATMNLMELYDQHAHRA
ncbi:MAG: hypothetical protein RLZZ241_1738 [Bacteroidota bacterium]|jgi:phosphate/sulfate permease